VESLKPATRNQPGSLRPPLWVYALIQHQPLSLIGLENLSYTRPGIGVSLKVSIGSLAQDKCDLTVTFFSSTSPAQAPNEQKSPRKSGNLVLGREWMGMGEWDDY